MTENTKTDTLTAIKSIDEATTTAVQHTDTLDHLLFQTVHEHPFSVSGGALIIGVTILKIIKKLRGK
ncbi:MAG: hypothetical protein LBJ89_01175 [Holosporales bacterium]|jgi:hypothetical protein|nr:hypothetical protein [Holosporales bacterium]